MLVYQTDSTDPAFNLALEEVLTRRSKKDAVFLWRNAPSIIIGRNQNAYGEIDVDYVRRREIPVVRRMTGGGAVFHDLGNVNFSFVTEATEDAPLSFGRFTAPVVKYLERLGVPACFSGRNDIEIDGQKISGNAQTQLGSRFLHHGTLLFDVHMSDLSAALKVNPLKIQSKGIRSVRARVTNICEHLREPMSVEEFKAGLTAFFAGQPGAKLTEFTREELAAAGKLADEKYRRWEWNFGENPSYSFRKAARFSGGILEVFMHVADEVVADVHITGDFFGFGEISDLEQALCGTPHRREALEAVLRDLPVKKYLGAITAEELIETMF